MENDQKAAVYEPTFRIVGDPGPLFAALAQAHQGFKPVLKTKTVKVTPRDSAAYTFTYAPLENILDATTAALAENGLTLLQLCPSSPGGYELRTLLCHASGAFIEQVMFIPDEVSYFDRNANEWRTRGLKIQELGSEITYKRRYSAQCVLGVNAEDDDDGNAADGNAATPADRQERKPRTQATPPAPKPRTERIQEARSILKDAESQAGVVATTVPGAAPPAESQDPDMATLSKEHREFAAIGDNFKRLGIEKEFMRGFIESAIGLSFKPGTQLTLGQAKALIRAQEEALDSLAAPPPVNEAGS